MGLSKHLEQLTSDDIEYLVLQQLPEDSVLEFKSELPGRTDQDRKEFLADVTSFSNSRGGYLIYGIEEADGCAIGIKGVDASEPNVLALESIIASGVDPRIAYNLRTIEVRGVKVLIFHIEKAGIRPIRSP